MKLLSFCFTSAYKTSWNFFHNEFFLQSALGYDYQAARAQHDSQKGDCSFKNFWPARTLTFC